MAERELAGKGAIVTGASRGIGRAIADLLAERGAAVAVNYKSDEAAARETVAAIERVGGRALAIQADVADVASIARMFDKAEAELGPLDVVVANAGFVLGKKAVDISEADYDAVFATNARGAFFTMQQGARRLRDGGRIVAISAAGTRTWFPGMSLYLGSKGALEQFVRVFSRELGRRNITVNAVLPGFTQTDMMGGGDHSGPASQSPFKRIGAPREVAEMVAFLASERAQWVTGQCIAADGGVSG
jgi:3-oxoacyl-[acyl-carrier protein] reductase